MEYPYSQTNYAAATAGVALRPPAIERLGADGTWQTIEPHAGYPAGLPRMMTLDLTGKLTGPRCVLRIKTNMECYYDQAFIAVRDRSAEKPHCESSRCRSSGRISAIAATRERFLRMASSRSYMITITSTRRPWRGFRAS